jgi:hypothetical protein
LVIHEVAAPNISGRLERNPPLFDFEVEVDVDVEVDVLASP